MALSPSIPPKHQAVVIAKTRAPLETLELDTVPPAEGEVLVRVQWAASTPLNLHNADGGLLMQPPFVMSACFSGSVVQVGHAPRDLQVGDKVFGFAWADQTQRPQQEYITIPAYLCGKVPPNVTLAQAASVPSNFATAVVTITQNLGLPLPWPVPSSPTTTTTTTTAEDDDDGDEAQQQKQNLKTAPVLIWGAASSVGQYTVQVLSRVWGYSNVLAVASAKHHDALRQWGARACFDYTQPDVVDKILAAVAATQDNKEEGTNNNNNNNIPYIVDCIGSVQDTLLPLSKIARRGTKVAIMLPVIVRHASGTEAPWYAMDVHRVDGTVRWEEGVLLSGVRTHFYPQDAFLRDKLLPEIMPALVGTGRIVPNRVRIVEGRTLLARAERALGMLRGREVSGEKLVWRVSEVEEKE